MTGPRGGSSGPIVVAVVVMAGVTLAVFGGAARAEPGGPQPTTTVAPIHVSEPSEAYFAEDTGINPVSSLPDERISAGPVSWRVVRANGTTTVTRDETTPISIDGDWGIAVVTARGHRSGASADGSTLVLAHGSARDWFAVVRNGRVSRVGLSGTFALDGVSNDGRTMFVIQTVDRVTGSYVVRKASALTGRLDVEPVLNTDVDESGHIEREAANTPMRGKPRDRLLGPDGWTYTLYSGDSHAYVHALDTAGSGRGLCFDLPSRWNTTSDSLQLAVIGDVMAVRRNGATLARLFGTRAGATPRIDRVGGSPA